MICCELTVRCCELTGKVDWELFLAALASAIDSAVPLHDSIGPMNVSAMDFIL
jgi:hypothetical protein